MNESPALKAASISLRVIETVRASARQLSTSMNRRRPDTEVPALDVVATSLGGYIGRLESERPLAVHDRRHRPGFDLRAGEGGRLVRNLVEGLLFHVLRADQPRRRHEGRGADPSASVARSRLPRAADSRAVVPAV